MVHWLAAASALAKLDSNTMCYAAAAYIAMVVAGEMEDLSF
jgi:hypothetical protein